MASFIPTRGTIFGDGCAGMLQFEAGTSVGMAPFHRNDELGFCDYRAGLDAGLSLKINGVEAEIVNVMPGDCNRQPAGLWGISSGGDAEGWTKGANYGFRLCWVDPAGHEAIVHQVSTTWDSNGLRWTAPSANAMAVLTFRDLPAPAGWTLRIYGCLATVQTDLAAMRLIKEIPVGDPSLPVGATQYDLKAFSILDANRVPDFSFAVMRVFFLLPSDRRVTLNTAATATMDANLIADEHGNATAALAAYPLANESLVDSSGWISGLSYARHVYVDNNRGSDTNTGLSPASPLKTLEAAWNSTTYMPDGAQNTCLHLAADSVFDRPRMGIGTAPRARWGTGPTGTDYTAAFFTIERWWNPDWGPDTGQRAKIIQRHVYWDRPFVSDYPDNGTSWQTGVNPTSTRTYVKKYILWKGVELATPFDGVAGSYNNGSGKNPNTSPGDFQVYSDCKFTLFSLGTFPSSGDFVYGNMFHRCIFDRTSGDMIDGLVEAATANTITLPVKHAQPWSAINWTAFSGSTAKTTFSFSTRWMFGVAGWTITASQTLDGTLRTETKTITSSSYDKLQTVNVDSAWTYNFTQNAAFTLAPPAGAPLLIVSGTGAGQTRTVASYDPATRTVTVSAPWDTTPDATSSYRFGAIGADGTRQSQGMYAENTQHALFSENAMDRQGWIGLDYERSDLTTNIYTHGRYAQYSNQHSFMWGEYISDCGCYGIEQRGGGSNAYQVYTKSIQAVYIGWQGGAFYKTLSLGQGYLSLQFQSSFNDRGGHQCVADGNIVLNIGNFNQAGRTGIGWNYCHAIGATVNDVPSDPTQKQFERIVLRNNTLHDSGGVYVYRVLPTFPLVAAQNVIGNTAATNMGGNGLQCWNVSSRTELTAGQLRVDRNRYYKSAAATQPFGSSLAAPGYGMAEWNAAGLDAQSALLAAAPTYANSAWTLADWASAQGVGTTESSLRDAFMNRPCGVWGDTYDCRKIYQAAAAAFSPDLASAPPVDFSPSGYLGAADNRAGVLLYLATQDRTSCTVGDVTTFTILASEVSNETLSITATNGTLSTSSLAWQNDANDRTFTFTATAPGLATVTVSRGAATIATCVVEVAAPPPTILPDFYRVRPSRGPRFLKRD